MIPLAKRVAPLITVGLLALGAVPAAAAECVGLSKDSFPCHFQILSHVSISNDSELISEAVKKELERYLRLRARNEMSFLRHEAITISDFAEKKPPPSESEWKNRGEMSCHVWTVGKTSTIAVLVECELAGWGSFTRSGYQKFSSRYLGTANSTGLVADVRDSITRAVEQIAEKFFASRDRAMAEQPFK